MNFEKCIYIVYIYKIITISLLDLCSSGLCSIYSGKVASAVHQICFFFIDMHYFLPFGVVYTYAHLCCFSSFLPMNGQMDGAADLTLTFLVTRLCSTYLLRL